MSNQFGEDFDFTPTGDIEKELNFAQACAITAVVVVALLFVGNILIGLN